MSGMGDQYRRGKLKVARIIVEELFYNYEHDTDISKALRTAFKALKKVDAILSGLIYKEIINGFKQTKKYYKRDKKTT